MLVDKLSDCKSYEQAIQNSGLSKSQLRTVDKQFKKLGISPVTLRNKALFDRLEIVEDL